MGLKNKGKFLPQRGRQSPFVCRRLSLTCAHSNLMRLLVASYSTPYALGLGRGEGKRCFLLMNPPANCLTLTPLLPCQHTYLIDHKSGKQQQQSAMKDDECERRTTTMDSRRRPEEQQKRTANNDRRGRRTITKKGGK
jgi:hypothetical protein